MQNLIAVVLQTHYPPKDSLFNWFFGPQFIGFILMVIGAVQYRYPPKKINDWYGYRTDTSKRNQETWDEAQRYSSLYMVKAGLCLIIIGFALVTVLNLAPLSDNHRFILLMPVFFASVTTAVILMLTRTEKHLTCKFGEK